MHLKFNPLYHYIFDIAAYLSSLVIYILQSRNRSVTLYSKSHFNRDYWRWLFAGVLIGAYLLGSFNLSLKGFFKVGHSIAGALFGGVISLEIYKLKNKIFESTGALFVLPLTIGIIIGRWGCYLSGLPDETYGVPTNKAWGVDFGDHLLRHPVQLYESGAMFLFLLLYLALARSLRNEVFKKTIFYIFVFYYSLMRFVFEFFKPYVRIFFGLNIFQWICIILLFYSACFAYRQIREDLFNRQ